MTKRYLFLFEDFSTLLSESPADEYNKDLYVATLNITEGNEMILEAVFDKMIGMALERTIDEPIRKLDPTLN